MNLQIIINYLRKENSLQLPLLWVQVPGLRWALLVSLLFNHKFRQSDLAYTLETILTVMKAKLNLH